MQEEEQESNYNSEFDLSLKYAFRNKLLLPSASTTREKGYIVNYHVKENYTSNYS